MNQTPAPVAAGPCSAYIPDPMTAVPKPVPESAWVLTAHGYRLTSTTASPGLAREFAAGLLLTEGLVSKPTELLEIQVRDDRNATALEARIERSVFDDAIEQRRHRDETGCGLLHWVTCDPASIRVIRSTPIPETDTLAVHLRALFDACSTERPGGGVHGAALIDADGAFVSLAVDVSRHAAVEKAVGAAFLGGADLSALGLALTARVSGRIALTASLARLAWIASRSVPTTLATRIADTARLTIVARVGSRDVHVFEPSSGDGAC